ncbi:ATP-binding protein [Massilia pinisoli]|uniref:ATP-binding protein n=1 Tax=Massilia pinisoli TaxID=1772194 RepID=A0ABT1ZYC3_9BURK|nr:ATP-binding protein [Massilia pinisoli]MCS0584927.1 ATP-binding protein [Massilia pinisoli]
MVRMRVKNFGPIRAGCTEDEGWIEIKRVTIFIGNQGSGKSTLAKLFSTFAWMEKALFRGDYDKKWFERKGRLTNTLLAYHRLENYISDDLDNPTSLEYEGEAYKITFVDGQLEIQELENPGYALPQVVYVPAERNFISYVRNSRELKISSDSLKEFVTVFDSAIAHLKGSVLLPINDVELEYDKLNNILNIKDKHHKLRLTDASSGFQSSVPLFVVTQYLADTLTGESESKNLPMSAVEIERFKNSIAEIFRDFTLTEEQRRVAVSVLSSRFNKSALVNIVEEPEQNLFPESQWSILKTLLQINNQRAANKIVMTTHSPYVVNLLSLSALGAKVKKDILAHEEKERLLSRLAEVIDINALVDAEDLIVFQANERDGTVKRLPTFEGIPTDKNYLNQFLKFSNEIFDQLLELEQEMQ